MSDNILILGKGIFRPVAKDRTIEPDSYLCTSVPNSGIFYVNQQGQVAQVDALPDGKSMLCLEPVQP